LNSISFSEFSSVPFRGLARIFSRNIRTLGLVGLCLASAPSSAVFNKTIYVVALSQDNIVVMIGGRYQRLAVGQSSSDGVKLISADSEAAVLEIEGKQVSYGLNAPLSNVAPPAPETASTRISPDSRGMYITTAKLNGHSTEVMVDTGATSVAMNESHASSLGLDYKKHHNGIVNVSTASGVAAAYTVSLDEVSINGVRQRYVEAVVVQGNFPRQILLGMSFLKYVDMQRQPNGILELKQRH
jgi:aspartyl protease family protein